MERAQQLIQKTMHPFQIFASSLKSSWADWFLCLLHSYGVTWNKEKEKIKMSSFCKGSKLPNWIQTE